MDISIKVVVSIVILVSAALILVFMINNQYAGVENYVGAMPAPNFTGGGS